MQWHPTKGLIVSGSKDNQIKYWDPRTGTCLSTLYVALLSTTFVPNAHPHPVTTTRTLSKLSLGLQMVIMWQVLHEIRPFASSTFVQ